jgi:hypothetical protein
VSTLPFIVYSCGHQTKVAEPDGREYSRFTLLFSAVALARFQWEK